MLPTDPFGRPCKCGCHRRQCCDLHGPNCEPPSELCCHNCTEAAHDTFPIRHADGSRCVLADASPAPDKTRDAPSEVAP